MTVQRPHVWRDECMAVGFTQQLHMATVFRHFRPNRGVCVCDVHTREMGDSFLLGMATVNRLMVSVNLLYN